VDSDASLRGGKLRRQSAALVDAGLSRPVSVTRDTIGVVGDRMVGGLISVEKRAW